jgi:hypothetical protein
MIKHLWLIASKSLSLLLLALTISCRKDSGSSGASNNPSPSNNNSKATTVVNSIVSGPATCDSVSVGQAQTKQGYTNNTVPFGSQCTLQTQSRQCQSNGQWSAWTPNVILVNSCKVSDNPDPDEDGLVGTADNCLNVSNVDQSDIDADGIGDVCDTDYEDQIANLLY